MAISTISSPKAITIPGAVLQVVSATITSTTTTQSTSYVDTAVTASITPTSATSKIFIILSASFYASRNNAGISFSDIYFNIVRNSTQITYDRIAINFGTTTWNDFIAQPSINYLDSPATTSSTTYKMQFFQTQASAAIVSNLSNYPSTITLMEIAA